LTSIGEYKDQVEIAKLKPIVEHLKQIIPVSIFDEVEKKFGFSDIHPEEVVLKSVETVSSYLFDLVQKGARNLTALIVDFGIMVIALYFLLRDGKRLNEEMTYLIPMTNEQKNRIFHRFYNILYAIMLSVIVTAGVNGFIVALIFRILGISFPVLAGVLSFIFSLLPVGGLYLCGFRLEFISF
jgi:predicted PurR-regulated permease PerM